ncbi:hypothetical protein GRI72_03050 [Altererythrobacter marinus]|uniref:Transposase n=1 Tax=Pelagerythrobacter marinus TaxID=538382 RepID=A0ABW9UT89_9SPHN|nr:hypothetical protein [Pelagerythrobacter marinus]MXO67810.1 hypothetical protein [Pelagerythrobacter marinus]
MNVYFEPLDVEELDRETVEQESDPDVLQGWLREQSAQAAELTEMKKAMSGTGGGIGVARKLGFTRLSILWIKNRLAQLDEAPADESFKQKAKRQARQLGTLQEALTKAKARNKELNRENEQLRAEIARLSPSKKDN